MNSIKYFTQVRSRLLLTDAARVTGYQHSEKSSLTRKDA